MKTSKLKQWYRQWDAGNFDFTAAAAGKETKSLSPRKEQPNSWKERPIGRLERGEKKAFRKLYPIMACVLCCVIIAVLLYTVEAMPGFGLADNPIHNQVSERYIVDGMDETGAVNIVAGVILDYRAFDTLGESHVLYAAATAVFILLLSTVEEKEPKYQRQIMQEDIILRSTVKVVVPIVLLFGIYVILNGHIGPGGGFSGGAVIGGGLILYSLAFGPERISRFLHMNSFRVIVLCALCFYSAAKCYSFFCGANGLETIFTTGVPGRIFSAGLILPLNAAVGIVVACTMYGFYSVFTRGRI